MRNDERLRTIYEVMAPYIVRNEHNWRDYLAFASQFHKHSFDNILLVYAQDEDVSILATRKQWAAIGRNLIPRAKGVAVCVYRNAKLTLDYLFDVSQTTGKEIHPTDWQLSDEMKKAHFDEHVAIVDAVRDRDAHTAATLMHEHLAQLESQLQFTPPATDVPDLISLFGPAEGSDLVTSPVLQA